LGLSLLNKNLEANHAQSFWLMGALLMQGKVVEKNKRRAVDLWEAGYMLGSVAATFDLGKYYSKDPSTFERGMSLIGLAAGKGFSPAIKFLTNQ
jgi:TPR repeat protein